jgi:hypothetical protein
MPTKERHAVFYVTVTDTDKDGILVDGPYLGGEVSGKFAAELLARDLANDKSIPGSVMPKIYEYGPGQTFDDLLFLAKRQFDKLAIEMYDQEAIQERMRRR